jgi:hypothetical protein
VLVMEVAQVGAVFKLGLQVGVVKLGCSSLGVQVGCSSRGVQVGCCQFLVSIVRWSKPPQHVKVNPLGEVAEKVLLQQQTCCGKWSDCKTAIR